MCMDGCKACAGEGQGRSQRGQGGSECPPDGKNFLKISHKNRENQDKWEEKGKIGKKMGSLLGACPCGRQRLATASGKGDASCILR